MTSSIPNSDLDTLLDAANPLSAARAEALPVTEAQRDLLEGVLACRHPATMPDAPRARPARWGLLPRLTLTVVVVFAALMAVLSLGDGAGERSGTVWAAELVRFAEASPLVLLHADGWHVVYADEQSRQEGELQFTYGPTPPPSTAPSAASAQRDVSTTSAALNWRGGDLSSWMRDRAASANVRTLAPVLGTTAHVYQYDGGRPGHQDITALWRQDGRVMEFRAGVADMNAFTVLLGALRKVDTNTWLSALPDSVVKRTDRARVIAGMLKGVTVPPGFDPGTIKGATLTKDRYQLGAAVTGTVACTWIKRWSDARAEADQAGVDEAIAAMATAKDWPILAEMAKSGAYPAVLKDLAAAMPSGRWYGRPLEGDVDSGLGCSELGIPLTNPSQSP